VRSRAREETNRFELRDLYKRRPSDAKGGQESTPLDPEFPPSVYDEKEASTFQGRGWPIVQRLRPFLGFSVSSSSSVAGMTPTSDRSQVRAP